MLEEIVFARRQSPPWADLATGYRRTGSVDPARYVPHHDIVGFPARVDRLIHAWNKRFAIDYFSCRATIAELSASNVAAARSGTSISFDDYEAVAERAARSAFLLFLHDDDDFFDPTLFDRIRSVADLAVDTHVFPLFRVHNDLVTFVRDGQDAEFVWGRRKSFDFRFQSNNYGISSRICSQPVMRHMKDHVEASAYAQSAGLSEQLYPFAVSATVKTPCSASVLPGILDNPKAFQRDMLAFADRFERADLPPAYAWLSAPLATMAQMFRAAAAKR